MTSLWTLLLMGLLGSLGHCVGMCTPVTLLLSRPAQQSPTTPPSRTWVFLLHLGRLTTYAGLGAVAGLLGHALQQATRNLRPLQGGLALLIAAVLLYSGLALGGWLPSLETLWSGGIRRWGRAVRKVSHITAPKPIHAYGLGLLWGLLPCGLVYAALLLAGATGQPFQGALAMFLFGLGTVPAMVGMGWLALRHDFTRRGVWRYAMATLFLLFGLQMTLRGLAAWGWVAHFHVGGFMLW